jgi:hypothetical protein
MPEVSTSCCATASDSYSLDDYVSRTVASKIGEKAKWSAADVIAEEIMNTISTETRASLGINFQVLVASALCEFNGKT